MISDRVSIKEVQESIAELVRQRRKRSGLSQEDLAGLLNLSRITISNLELGKNATLDTLLKVFQHLDILENFNAYIAEEIRNNRYDSLY